jgi:transcriptional regulator with GAF, ATPase, and Fis domain
MDTTLATGKSDPSETHPASLSPSGPFQCDGRQLGLIGRSVKMQQVLRLVDKIAASEATVIIQGETGTGKGLVARAIHTCSPRCDKPFIAVNCGAIPENLLESELFGHVRGAFTGATATKPGKFELAAGGTIFLDEIGDMSPDLQVKVLRVLEEKEFEPVGGCRTQKADVRIIAATHRDLEQEVAQGRFRQDLFYRLYVIPLSLAPLRERSTDVPLLVEHFLGCCNQCRAPEAALGMAPEALALLAGYSWPGNVRELKNLIERLVVLSEQGTIRVRDLPRRLREAAAGRAVEPPVVEITEEGICLNTAVSEFEKSLIAQSLEKANWVKNKAAKLLHLKRTTLVEKIKKMKIEAPYEQILEQEDEEVP